MLDINDVSFSYGTRKVLDAIRFSVAPGKIVALLGTNGAGKSTLLKTISGELHPSSGGVAFDGKPVREWHPLELARKRAVLPQTPSLAFNFSVRDVVMMGRSPHLKGTEGAHDREICQRALERVDLGGFRERSYLELSGGERQRVHLARVLAQIGEPTEEPRYLLMDEPVAGLDLAHQHSTLQIARELAAEGVGVLTVLHELNLALAYADETVLLHENRVNASGPTLEVLTAERVSDVFQVRATPHVHTDGLVSMLIAPR